MKTPVCVISEPYEHNIFIIKYDDGKFKLNIY